MKNLILTLLTCLILLLPNVVLCETMNHLVKRNGIYYKKFSDVPFNGEITGDTQGAFMNGKRDGTWVYFNKNGQINTKGDFKNGVEEGSWVSYHENSKLYTKGDYKNGKKEGPWVRYWNNNQLMSKGNFKNDKKEGVWVSFNQDGTLIKEWVGSYKGGKKIRN
jgi:antitoxin component YwqK of YwqJK toxin-antitoxin module